MNGFGRIHTLLPLSEKGDLANDPHCRDLSFSTLTFAGWLLKSKITVITFPKQFCPNAIYSNLLTHVANQLDQKLIGKTAHLFL